MEDVNPFALEPEQVEMIRAAFYFVLIAELVEKCNYTMEQVL